MLPRYDIARSYDWNYRNAPPVGAPVAVPSVAGEWRLCGFRLNSPLGIPAGPLLNSGWIRYYASLGFDALTYKTVRSRYRASYEPPNLLPVSGGELRGEGGVVRAVAGEFDSWAISFGMPSREPSEWMADVGVARAALGDGQVLVVSVVASPMPEWGIREVALDFAACASKAVSAGAQIVEANLSCPNVCTAEADLYLSASASGVIAREVRAAVGPDVPVLLKVGLFENATQMADLVAAVRGVVNGISATNSITARVSGASGEMMFDGLRRGIGGACITARCLEETRVMAALTREAGLELVSVGGVCTGQDVLDRLSAGASHVQVATAAMIDPLVGVRMREALG